MFSKEGYIIPAKKEWQGLSDKDVMDLTNFWNISDIEIEPFITMVANKVKENNNGI